MPNYRRYYIPNAIVFITAVTKDRKQYFVDNNDVELFFSILKQVQQIHPFHMLAYVILPDHFHLLIQPGNDIGNFSVIIKSLKWNYTLDYKKLHHIKTKLTIWQRGFWDHVIRTEADLKNHVDYIHWNPIKHGYTEFPHSWKYSSYRYWCQRGYYPSLDERTEPPAILFKMDFE